MTVQVRCRRLLLGSLVPLLAFQLAGCSTKEEGETLEQGRSALTVSLTASNANTLKVRGGTVSEVVVHLTKVTAHSVEAGWVTLSEKPLTVDLLKLQASASDLGVGNLPAGKVTQLRLYVDAAGDNHVVTAAGETVPLKVPSGSESGIKVKGPFNLDSCEASEIDLDFDVSNSVKVHPAQQGEIYLLRPVIRLKNHTHKPVTCTPATDGGTVGDGSTDGGDDGSADGGDDGDDGEDADHGKGHDKEKPWKGQCGHPCEDGDACFSGHCGGSDACEPGATGAPCEENSDCASASCGEDGQCAAPTPTPGTTPPGSTTPGDACSAPSECQSGSCEDGVCQTGGQGAPCQFYTQCDNGLTCTEGFCVPALN